jgi:7-carboxy-7-deazaguanine synthase
MSDNLVKCLICSKDFKQVQSHLKYHNLTSKQYLEKFPEAKLFSKETKEKHRISVQKRDRPDWRLSSSLSLKSRIEKGERWGGNTIENSKKISTKIKNLHSDPSSVYNSLEYHEKLKLGQENRTEESIKNQRESIIKALSGGHIPCIKCTNIYGEKFQSISEMNVANYFRSKSIKYDLHKVLRFKEKYRVPDFFINDKSLYVEFFGSIWRSLPGFLKKVNLYTKNNVNFIGLYHLDLKDLDFAMSCIDKRMNISEVFFSACGEGREQGKLATFIRSYSCNRSCLYCDTKYSLKGEYKSLSIRQILDLIYFDSGNSNCKKVFLTGGEITIQENFKYLVETLYKHKIETILQTNGTTFLPNEFDRVTWLSVDIKGPSSGKIADQNIIENIYQRYSGIDKKLDDFKTQFKYVVSNEEDYIYAKQNVLKYPNVVHLLQPEWNSFQEDRAWLANRMLYDNEIRKNFSDVRLSLQMHKFYGLK